VKTKTLIQWTKSMTDLQQTIATLLKSNLQSVTSNY